MRGNLSVTREAAFIGYQLECIQRSSRSRSFGSVRSCGRSRGVRVAVPPRALRDQVDSRALINSSFNSSSECERDGHKPQMLCLASELLSPDIDHLVCVPVDQRARALPHVASSFLPSSL